MFLEVGNVERIDNPSSDQIAQHLRNLPPEAPFLILTADEDLYIQTIRRPAGDLFRVEWRQESERRFILVPVERAEECFQAFLRWDEAALKSFPWKRLTFFNDPHRQVVVAWLIQLGIIVVMAIKAVWTALR